MKRTLPIAVVLLALAGAVWWLWNDSRRLRAELNTAQAAAAELAQLREANEALRASQVGADELARLRAGQSELLSLRGEVTRLRRELQEANAALARERQAAARRPEPPPPAPEPAAPAPAAVVPFTARVADGETIIAGGWRSVPGRWTVAFLTPKITSAAGQITVSSQFIDAPAGVWDQLGLGDVESRGVGLVTLGPGRGAVVFNALSAQPGVAALGGPTISTSDGVAMKISQSLLPQPGASSSGTLVLEVLPRITPDRTAVDLTGSATRMP